ncbi:protein-glutamate methylesterase/protein-glutamine glutaminase [Motilibacter deserti]|uniref:protein-glutamate methylesterase/protein-glutamine glutaminase n=1 Tax=Motilibacter deserti TaxID=2714956 RepID=UPI002F2B8790
MGDIRVLVVDDSAVVRRIVAQVLDAEPGISVVGTAQNGRIALEKLTELSPDAVTLDIEMPELDGLGTLKELRKTHPRTPVIMFSTLTERGASATIEALSLGASDYVTKPSNTTALTQSVRSVREQLVPKLRSLCGGAALPGGMPAAAQPGRRYGAAAAATGPAGAMAASARRPGTAGRPAPGAPTARLTPAAKRPDILVIGSSTGGPEALARVLGGLPASLPVPVAVVQHMPPIFTRLLAERLSRSSALDVREAAQDDQLVPGRVLIAPGDRHLEVVRRGTGLYANLTTAPPENFCRPAVDVLFRSVATVFGGSVLAVVLTGMGSDGKLGAQVLKTRGARVLAQDQSTSVVWGMPGAVTTAGLADAVLPLDAVPGAIVDSIGLAGRPRSAGATEAALTRGTRA